MSNTFKRALQGKKAASLPERQLAVLLGFHMYNSKGRKRFFSDASVQPSEIKQLIEGGFLTQSGRGVRVSPQGKAEAASYGGIAMQQGLLAKYENGRYARKTAGSFDTVEVDPSSIMSAWKSVLRRAGPNRKNPDVVNFGKALNGYLNGTVQHTAVMLAMFMMEDVIGGVDRKLVNAIADYERDRKAAGTGTVLEVNRGEVARAGRYGRTWYWIHTRGLKNSYSDEAAFFMSLRDAGLDMNDASQVVRQLGGRKSSLYEATQKLRTTWSKIREAAARKQYNWKTLTIVPGHRKNVSQILEVIGARATGDVDAMLPKTDEGKPNPDFYVLKKKYSGGRPFAEGKMKGKITTKGGKKLFVGTITGIGECILCKSGFKA